MDPLLSVQVTKNDYGEKVVKPLVNLHVTPNSNIIHKIGSLFQQKKEALFGGGHGNYGGGYGGGYGGPTIHHSHVHYGASRPPPQYHHGPPPPHYGPPTHHYGPSPHHHGPSFHHDSPPFIQGPSHPPYFGSGPGGYGPSGGYRNAEYDDDEQDQSGPYVNDADDLNVFSNNGGGGEFYGRSTSDANHNNGQTPNTYAQMFNSYSRTQSIPNQAPGQATGGRNVKFPSNRRRRDLSQSDEEKEPLNDEIEQRSKTIKVNCINKKIL